MSSDPQKSKFTQQGFHRTFGNGGKIHGDSSQRPSGDAPSNLKRNRPVDRPDERSAAAQRDRVEGPGPTPTASHKSRQPGKPKKSHSSERLTLITANSLRPVLDSVCKRMMWFQARHKHSKILDSSRVIQEQCHYHPSDYPGSADLLVNQDKQIRDDIATANQSIASTDETIAAALQPLLQHISEVCAKNCNTSRPLEERAVSEARLAAVSLSLKKEAQDSIKQEAADAQKRVQELVESQMAKLKDAIVQENEQKLEKRFDNKLHSLRVTLSLEAEERITSLRKTLAHDYERRVIEMREAITQGNREKVEELERVLSETNQKNATLHKKMASLEARLDQSASEQRRLLESLVDETELSQQLQQLSVSKDEKLSKLEARLQSLPNHVPRIEQLEEGMREHSRLIEKKAQQQDAANSRLELLESTVSKAIAEAKQAGEHAQGLDSSHQSAGPMNVTQILEVIRHELNNSEEKSLNHIKKIRDSLPSFLLKERAAREALESLLVDLDGKISELERESSATKTQLSDFIEYSTKQRQLLVSGLDSLEDGINNRLNLAIGELKPGAQGTKPEFELSKDDYEGICLQLQALNNWQTNFNTRGLYRDIVTFIHNTLPESARLRMDRLEGRLAAFENSISHKRRKLPGSNAAVVNGHQSDSG